MEKVFITKYALTKGILEKEVKIQDHGNGYIRAYEKGGFPSYSLGKECFRTREQAMERAEKMRLKKIAPWRKQMRICIIILNGIILVKKAKLISGIRKIIKSICIILLRERNSFTISALLIRFL